MTQIRVYKLGQVFYAHPSGLRHIYGVGGTPHDAVANLVRWNPSVCGIEIVEDALDWECN
jgi:hypothetical protein